MLAFPSNIGFLFVFIQTKIIRRKKYFCPYYPWSNEDWILSRSDAEYNNSACWSTEIEQYLNDDDLLPFVKTCIEHFYVDYATTPPQRKLRL